MSSPAISKMPAPRSPITPTSSRTSSHVGHAARHGPSVRGLVVAGARGREAHGAGGQRVGQLALHRRQVSAAVGRLGERALAHGVGAQRRVPDVARVVDPLGPARDGVEVLGVGLPRPLDARLHRLGGDVLGALEVAHDEVPLVGPARRQREAAVAHHDAGHAVPARAGAERIPRDLRVHVGVAVDEAGRHHVVARVDLLAPALRGWRRCARCVAAARRRRRGSAAAPSRPPPCRRGSPGRRSSRTASLASVGDVEPVELGDVVVEDQVRAPAGASECAALLGAARPASAATSSRCAGSRWPTSAGGRCRGPSPGRPPSRPGTWCRRARGSTRSAACVSVAAGQPVAVPLVGVVHAVHEVRHPAGVGLDAHELELRMALEHAAEDEDADDVLAAADDRHEAR